MSIIEETKREETNIVVLCDGTWNHPSVKTNVYKLYGLLCGPNGIKKKETPSFITSFRKKLFNKSEYDDLDFPPREAQVYGDYYYETGVGGRIDVINASVARELDNKIKNAYRHIVQRYNHKDNKSKNKKIWLFGFSRGAYTVRCVAGMIQNSGILRYDSKELIDRAYELYRSRSPVHSPNGQESENFRKSFSHPPDSINIKFLGLWDTVGAHGLPTITVGKGFEYLKLHDLTISTNVQNVYQALSIHEKLSLFEPCRVFRNNEECRNCEECRKGEEFRKSECIKIKKIKLETKLEEIWFPGDHLEVGGGVYSTDQSISNKSLLWMIKNIVSTGGLLSEELLEMEKLEERLKELGQQTPRFKRVEQKILSQLPVFTVKRIIGYFPLMHRDRIIPLYRDNEGKLTLDRLYNKGDWSELNAKKLKIINGKKPNSLTKFYAAIEEILIEELKGCGEIISNAKDENGMEVRDIHNKDRHIMDSKDEMDRETIRDLFGGEIDEERINNIKSFSALTISNLNVENIESIKKKWKIIKEMENNND